MDGHGGDPGSFPPGRQPSGHGDHFSFFVFFAYIPEVSPPWAELILGSSNFTEMGVAEENLPPLLMSDNLPI